LARRREVVPVVAFSAAHSGGMSAANGSLTGLALPWVDLQPGRSWGTIRRRAHDKVDRTRKDGGVTLEQRFLEQLPVVNRVIAWVCARRCLRGADAEDFGSVVKSRLVENDYQVLAKFEGRSSLKTYLAAAVNRMYLDFQVQRFGKWRSSAEARRLGPSALRLECLLYRDNLTFDEACGVLETDPRVGESRDALRALCQKIPSRSRRGPPTEGPEPVATDRPSADLERAERQALAERTFSVIRRSLARLPARNRLFLRLHLNEGLTVAEAARTLGLEQKPLYRRKEEILKGLRVDLEGEGIGPGEARELLSSLDWDAVLTIDAPASDGAPENAVPRPSEKQVDAGQREGGR